MGFTKYLTRIFMCRAAGAAGATFGVAAGADAGIGLVACASQKATKNLKTMNDSAKKDEPKTGDASTDQSTDQEQ